MTNETDNPFGDAGVDVTPEPKRKRAKREAPPPRQSTVSDAVADAFSEFEALAEEMGQWRDNIEEKFSATEKFERVSEAADALENLRQPETGDEADNLAVTIQDPPRTRKGPSRSDRRDQAVMLLELALDAIASKLIDLENDREHDQVVNAAMSELEDLRDEIEDAKSEAENIEFPGMFG